MKPSDHLRPLGEHKARAEQREQQQHAGNATPSGGGFELRYARPIAENASPGVGTPGGNKITGKPCLMDGTLIVGAADVILLRALQWPANNGPALGKFTGPPMWGVNADPLLACVVAYVPYTFTHDETTVAHGFLLADPFGGGGVQYQTLVVGSDGRFEVDYPRLHI